MTLKERLTKNLLFFIVLVYYLGGYFILNESTSRRQGLHYLPLPWEKSLPFFPALILGYMLIFAFIAFTYLLVDDLSYFKKVVKAFLICITIHFIIFFIFPVEYLFRPEIDPEKGWAYLLVSFYYWLDLPYNSFPSMHISNAFLVSFLLQRYRPGLGWILHPMAVIVAISVVLVKQHYIADVVAGFFVAWGVYRLTFWEFGIKKTALETSSAVIT